MRRRLYFLLPDAAVPTAVDVVTLPSPGALLSDEGDLIPASYMNFYIGNAAVVVPTFNDPADREAKLKREQEAQKARLAKYRQVIEKFRALVSSGKLKIRNNTREYLAVRKGRF